MGIEEKYEEALKPTNDYVFKRIFGHKGNEEITKNLINSILKQKVEIVDLGESTILEKDLRDDKVGILDIKARLDEHILCNLEMQVVKYSNIVKRIMYYWSKLYTSEVSSGKDYNELNKTIVIMIADFELDVTKHIPKYHTKWEIREEEFFKTVLTDVLEINIIELPKLKKAKVKIKEDNQLKLWTKFLISPDEIGEKDMEENKEIKKAKEELDKINQDEYEKELARLRLKHVMDQKAIQDYGIQQGKERGIKEGFEIGIKQGIKEGIEQGIEQGIVKVAKRMIELKMPIERIRDITGLSEEEIEKIK